MLTGRGTVRGRPVAVVVKLPGRRGELTDRDAWECILSTRAEGRVGVRDLLRYGAASTLRLKGTDAGERDDSVLVALTRLDGQPCVRRTPAMLQRRSQTRASSAVCSSPWSERLPVGWRRPIA